MDKENSWVDKFAKGIHEYFGNFFIPFTTPFFALYNCSKLMDGVENKYLKIMIFVVSMIYVTMSLVIAIYMVIIKRK